MAQQVSEIAELHSSLGFIQEAPKGVVDWKEAVNPQFEDFVFADVVKHLVRKFELI